MYRLVLDFKNKADADLLVESLMINNGEKVVLEFDVAGNKAVEASIVEEAYAVEGLEEQLRSLKSSIEALSRSGISMKLMEVYIRQKGVSKAAFDAVMRGMKEFFREIK